VDKTVTRQLLPGERVVATNEILTLTNYRVFRDAAGGGNSRYVSISLDAIASCGLVTTSQPILLVLGILAGCAGLVLGGDLAGPAIIAAIVLVAAYFGSRQAVMSICSTGGERIIVPTKPSQRASQRGLLDAIDHAKLAALGRIAEAAPSPAMPRPHAPAIAEQSASLVS
jgi:hypothetical protein